MYLLIIILNKEKYLDDVLSCLVELGVEDATILDTQPLEFALAYKVPIFAGLKLQLGERTQFSKTILFIVENMDMGKEIIKLLKTVGIDLEAKGVARIITLKIESVFGNPPDVNI